MKKYSLKFKVIILFSLTIFAVAALFLTKPNANTSEVRNVPIYNYPKIEVYPDSYDLGTVVYGEVAKKVFEIKNVSNEPLEIQKVSTSCGCTKAVIEDDVKSILPGKSANMIVTFDPAAHKDDSDLGKIVRIIYIKSNDPEKPEIEIKITANVIKAESSADVK